MKQYAIYLCGDTGQLVTPYPDCQNAGEHTPCPEGYGEFHDWAAKKSRTHVQRLCGSCDRWTIWVPKGVTS